MANVPHTPASHEEAGLPVASHGGRVWDEDGRPRDCFDFSANIWPHSFSPSLLQTCLASLDVYPDPQNKGLISAASAYYGIEKPCIFPANGSTEALYLAMLTLRPSRVAIFEPTFSEYARAAQWGASDPVELIHLFAKPADSFRPTLLVPDANVAVLCNPNNPTGVLCDPIELIAWIDQCTSAGVFVIVDEAFIEFAGGKQLSLVRNIATRPNLLVLRSMTKCFGIPGIRLGFAIGSPSFIEKMSANHIPWSVNVIAQQLGIAIARGPNQNNELAATVATERAYLSNHFREFGWTIFPSSANFLLCKLLNSQSKHNLLHKLNKLGFLLRDAGNFPGLDDSYIRCAVRTHSDNLLLVRAIAQCL
jgi:threonine-phosphate decarboxylase